MTFLEATLVWMPPLSQVAATRPAILLKKTPSKVFFKDSAKIINCLLLFLNPGITIFKEHLIVATNFLRYTISLKTCHAFVYC